jgi:ERCC4-related helicase
LAALQKLKDAYGALIRKSYFKPDESEEKLLEEEVRECRRKLCAAIVAARESNTSLLVLPTGLGKTGVMCLLPFILPLRRSRSVVSPPSCL